MANNIFIFIIFFTHLNLFSQKQCIEDISNYTGTCIQYFADGTKKLVTFKNGLLDSTMVVYDAKGNITSEENYKNDKLNGALIYFYPDGKIKKSIEFTDNIYDGKIVEYYKSSGLPKYESFYKMNVAEGEWKSYHENGLLSSIDTFVNGKLNGWRYDYFSNGKLKLKLFYKDGSITGEGFFYYENGQLKEVSNSFKSAYHGLVLKYNDKGRLIGREYYEMNELKKKRLLKFMAKYPFKIEKVNK